MIKRHKYLLIFGILIEIGATAALWTIFNWKAVIVIQTILCAHFFNMFIIDCNRRTKEPKSIWELL
ncbi:hypothetical protein HGH93_21700 [Chitinophaga polysaccharea]|nr:hypothetical protein [Chitinophaga polysaccharea]